jgi:hypothetical protein
VVTDLVDDGASESKAEDVTVGRCDEREGQCLCAVEPVVVGKTQQRELVADAIVGRVVADDRRNVITIAVAGDIQTEVRREIAEELREGAVKGNPAVLLLRVAGEDLERLLRAGIDRP